MRLIIAFLTILFAPHPAMSQALSPMNGEVKTYTDVFALQLKALNPYDSAQQFSVRILDDQGAPVKDVQMARSILNLPPSATNAFYIWGKVAAERRIMVCLTSPYFSNGVGAQIRGEVCGKYHITRLGQ
ncbi:hypothetical protein [Hyphococcus lacteus]|uniref:Uncharacterized protein n=1 Tax=Hyphococcus lacteus TaxID=3143536 RepID=A0ABV3Z4H0_9PROT